MLPESAAPRPSRGRSGTILATVVFAAMIAAIVYRYWPSDDRSIRRHLSNLAESLSLPDSERDIQKLARFAALREYFTPDVSVIVGNRAIGSREAVFGILERVQPPPGGLHVSIADITVIIADNRESAVVTLTAAVSRKDRATGETIADMDAVSLSMVKLHDDWVIASAETYPR